MRVYTYYADVPTLPRFDELKLITLWREAWKPHGFEPFVLSEWHARQHPLFEDMNKVAAKLPSINPAGYDLACFLRWLALAQVGGGLMSDYDVFPLPNWAMPMMPEGMVTLLQENVPSLVYCREDAVQNLCGLILGAAANGFGWGKIKGQDHCSDMLVIQALINSQLPDKPIFHTLPYVQNYGTDNWRLSRAVHFANSVLRPLGLMPRWKHIPKLLEEAKCEPS